MQFYLKTHYIMFLSHSQGRKIVPDKIHTQFNIFIVLDEYTVVVDSK